MAEKAEKKTAPRKRAAKKAPVKKTVPKKQAVKKAPVKKTAAKRTRTATTPTARKRTASRATNTTRTERSSGMSPLAVALAILAAGLLIALAIWVRKDNNTASAAATVEVDVQNTPTETPTNVGDTPADDTPTDNDPPAGTPATPTDDTATEPVSMALCLADKIATVNEVDEAHLQRMEITTGDVIHLDYYNIVDGDRKDAVSVIVHAGEAAVLAGYGSEWQFPTRDCEDFDFVSDASGYAAGRLVSSDNDWGHSGLVYASLADFLNGNDPVVNIRKINPQDPSVSQPILWDDTNNGVIK